MKSNRVRPSKVRRLFLAAGLILSTLVVGGGPATDAGAPRKDAPPANAAPGIPIHFKLDSPAQVTLAVEDAKGDRVRNLVAETLLPAGENTVYWDGYGDGAPGAKGEWVRRRVKPGVYHVRGLTHGGIEMRYEMTVNNPGSPPWETRDGAGGWLADHSPPADVLYLPDGAPWPGGKGKARFLVCSTSGEAGSEFVWLDAEGRRLYGANDGFWGGTHLARDPGPKPAAEYCAYVFESGQRDADNFTLEVRAFRSDDGRLERIVQVPRPRSLRTFKDMAEAYGSDGLAAYDGRVVFAVTMLDKLVFADVRRKKVVAEVGLKSPRSPTFDATGRLYVLSEGKVKSFRVAADEPALEDEQTVVGDRLTDPRRLRLGPDGNLYVSDWGTDHQVKVFSPEGRLLRTIGRPGGPQVGHYDEERMANPCGVGLDDRGRLWVAEGGLPKRVSVWKTDGTFVKAFYGPEKYGGGGALDPRDRKRFYYEEAGAGLEFALDWETGASKVKNVYWRPDAMGDCEPMPGPAPERAFYVGRREYLVNSYNGGLRYNQDRGVGVWRMDDDGVARPVAMVGNGADLVNGVWGWRMKNRDAVVRLWEGRKPQEVLFVWCDRNGDGVAQPDEIQWVAEDHAASPQHDVGGIGLEPLIHPDLSFTTAYGTRIPPPQIDPHGVPLYDLEKRTKVGDREELRSPLVVGNRVVTHRDSDDSWVGCDLEGAKRWRYPATPEAEVGGPGVMVAPTRLLGPAVTPTEGEAGPVVAINGEMGAMFLMTTDGLFLQTLGGDARLLPPLSEKDPKRGRFVRDVTFRQEHFHPTINQTADGLIYLTAGFQEGSLLLLDGWKSVRRRDFGELKVGSEDLAGVVPASVRPARKEGRPEQTISILSKAPTIDGDLSDWPADAAWMRIDDRAEAAAAVDAQNLYLAFRTDDPRALDNASRDHRYVFKGGGAFDVMLGTDPEASGERHSPTAGDLRLVVTRVDRRVSAVLYRAVAPGAPAADKVLFESPIDKVAFDQVRQIGDQVRVAQVDGAYEIAVPLKTLGLHPSAGAEILADVGVLRGREGRTMGRSYWSNPDSVLVSDLPGEARLRPERWGVWRFR